MTHRAAANWFQEHFNEDYLVLYEGRSDEQAQREVDFLRRELGLDPGSRVLDLCCGAARHLRAILTLECEACGFDLSAALLEHASGSFPSLAGRLGRGDMRHLPFSDGSFDRVVSFFTSFGYFDQDREHRKTVREFARMLGPGGRFSLDLMNRSYVLDRLVPFSTRKTPHHLIEETRTFDEARQRVEKSIRLVDRANGSHRNYFESVRVFTLDEITTLLETAGLRIDHVFGDFSDTALADDSPRMLLIGGLA